MDRGFSASQDNSAVGIYRDFHGTVSLDSGTAS